MESIKLDKIIVLDNRVDYYFTPSKKLKKFFANECHLFIEYDFEIKDIPESILVIPFVSNIIPLVWLTNSILWINEIDREYYDSIPKIKYAYQEMYSNFILKGTIVPAKTINNNYEIEREAVELFSGGLDAITTFIRIREKNPILINIYGWYYNKIEYNKVFESDKKNILDFSLKNNVEAVFAKSNFGNFIISSVVDKKYSKKLGDSWWHGLQHAMAFIGISIPLAYKYKVRNIYIASSFTLGENREPCASDPTIDIQSRYASGGVIHDGFELTRPDKTRIIVAEQKRSGKNLPLRVCSFNDKNCCNCEKCFRTILGLIAEGADISKFDFLVEGDLLERVQNFLSENVKFMKDSYIETWEDIIKRMIENRANIQEKELIDWLANYDFKTERRKALFIYRTSKFFPIMKRKVQNILKGLKLKYCELRGKYAD